MTCSGNAGAARVLSCSAALLCLTGFRARVQMVWAPQAAPGVWLTRLWPRLLRPLTSTTATPGTATLSLPGAQTTHMRACSATQQTPCVQAHSLMALLLLLPLCGGARVCQGTPQAAPGVWLKRLLPRLP
jgi:hypothetical protein